MNAGTYVWRAGKKLSNPLCARSEAAKPAWNRLGFRSLPVSDPRCRLVETSSRVPTKPYLPVSLPLGARRVITQISPEQLASQFQHLELVLIESFPLCCRQLREQSFSSHRGRFASPTHSARNNANDSALRPLSMF